MKLSVTLLASLYVICTLTWYDYQNGIGSTTCKDNVSRAVHFSQFSPNASSIVIGETLEYKDKLFYRCKLVKCSN